MHVLCAATQCARCCHGAPLRSLIIKRHPLCTAPPPARHCTTAQEEHEEGHHNGVHEAAHGGHEAGQHTEEQQEEDSHHGWGGGWGG